MLARGTKLTGRTNSGLRFPHSKVNCKPLLTQAFTFLQRSHQTKEHHPTASLQISFISVLKSDTFICRQHINNSISLYTNLTDTDKHLLATACLCSSAVSQYALCLRFPVSHDPNHPRLVHISYFYSWLQRPHRQLFYLKKKTENDSIPLFLSHCPPCPILTIHKFLI